MVIMHDGTKCASSVLLGGGSRITPGKPPQLVAAGIRGAASLCFDPKANLVGNPDKSEQRSGNREAQVVATRQTFPPASGRGVGLPCESRRGNA